MTGPLGPSVLISGSNRGLGLAIVRQLITANGIQHIFAGCRNPDKADELNKLAQKNKILHVIKLDIQNDDDIKEAEKFVEETLGNKGLNVLINNAAILTETGADYKHPNRKILNQHMSTNITSHMMMTSAFLQLLQKDSSADKPSLIVNISSDCGSVGDAPLVGAAWGNYAYGMTKAAINQYTRYLSTDLSYNHIVAVAVHPGWLRTDMGTSSAPISADEGSRPLINTLQKLTIKDNGRYIDRHGNDMRF